MKFGSVADLNYFADHYRSFYRRKKYNILFLNLHLNLADLQHWHDIMDDFYLCQLNIELHTLLPDTSLKRKSTIINKFK